MKAILNLTKLFNSFIGVLSIIIVLSCRSEDKISAPTITTKEITSITKFSAIARGSIVSNYNDILIASGVCWNTKPSPTIANNRLYIDYFYNVLFFNVILKLCNPQASSMIRSSKPSLWQRKRSLTIRQRFAPQIACSTSTLNLDISRFSCFCSLVNSLPLGFFFGI